jgi:hypothetical protein
MLVVVKRERCFDSVVAQSTVASSTAKRAQTPGQLIAGKSTAE